MDKKTKEIMSFVSNRVRTQKTMFIPVFAISAFAIVGYTAADRTAPVVHSNTIEVPYGTVLKASDFAISDNRDNTDTLKTKIHADSYEKNQLGTYTVDVTVKDAFNNETTKTVNVKVVDNEAPVLESRNDDGFVINVEANGSNDLKQYIKATDNVDGDVTDFVNFDKELDTTQLGEQVINASVEDNMGNIATKTFTFNVGDTSAPEMNLKNGNFVVNYGDNFDINNYVSLNEEGTVTLTENVDTTNTGTVTTSIKAKDKAGNVSEKNITVNVEKNFYQRIADAALAQIGVYQDCTMLVTNSLAAVGINFHGAPAAYLSLGALTNNPVPGDICVYQGHVALYIGNGQAVHGGWFGCQTTIYSVECNQPFIGYVHVNR